MRIFILLSLVFYMLNADTKLNVCYTKKIVSEETGNLAYVGCKRYNDSCKSNNKLHFGKYPSGSKASAALQRCLKSAPKFVNSGKESDAYVSKKSSTSSSKQSYSKPQRQISDPYYVGACVSMKGRMAIFLSITVKGYIEAKGGNNQIKIRIADTEGTTPYYKGVSLYQNTIIWDNKYNWKLCR